MHEIFDVHNKLPDEIPEIQPYQEKIYCIKLDEGTQHHVHVYTEKSGIFRFKNSLSYWTDYFNRHGCQFEKVHRYQAINLEKLVGYGWDNATYGPWWADLGCMRLSINKRTYNHFNKSEYRYLNKSVTLRKRLL
ncbi:hypothetical protein ABFV99_13575 [Cytobacillus horneckiae]|uniref:hypothetical protein n=1 Tax=Cytobacillus horneckiae TaxID=549687 RepID=UPI0034CD08EE